MWRSTSARLAPAMPRSSLAEAPAGIVPIGVASIMAAAAMMLAIWAYGQATAVSELQAFDLAELPPGAFRYHQGGDFSRDGFPVMAPTVTAVIARGLVVNAGHGLNYTNLPAFLEAVPHLHELNIGHSIVSRAVFTGMDAALLQTVEAQRKALAHKRMIIDDQNALL